MTNDLISVIAKIEAAKIRLCVMCAKTGLAPLSKLIETYTSEIKILDKWRETLPDAEEQQLCYERYIQNGYFDRSIVIDDGKFLKDGYMAYRVARAVGLQTVKVSQIHLTIRYPEETPPEPIKLTFWQRVFAHA